MFNWFNRVIEDYYKPETYELLVTDTNGDKHSLAGLCSSLAKEVVELKEKYSALLLDVKRLEEENVELTNSLYEIMQSVDEVNIKIDKIHPVIYNLHQKE